MSLTGTQRPFGVEELKPEAVANCWCVPSTLMLERERQCLYKVVFNLVLHFVVPFPTGEACFCKDAGFLMAAHGEWGSAIELHPKHILIH